MESPTLIRQADGPEPLPNVWGVDRLLRRWLDRHENSHLTPIDPTKVLIRPHTPEEAEARSKRLNARARGGDVHEKGFSLPLKRRQPSPPVLPPPPPQGCSLRNPLSRYPIRSLSVQFNPKPQCKWRSPMEALTFRRVRHMRRSGWRFLHQHLKMGREWMVWCVSPSGAMRMFLIPSPSQPGVRAGVAANHSVSVQEPSI